MSLSKSEIFDEEIVAEGLPMEIPDPQFFGIEDNTNVRCHHWELPERKVAFDMAATGSRETEDVLLCYGLTILGLWF